MADGSKPAGILLVPLGALLLLAAVFLCAAAMKPANFGAAPSSSDPKKSWPTRPTSLLATLPSECRQQKQRAQRHE